MNAPTSEARGSTALAVGRALVLVALTVLPRGALADDRAAPSLALPSDRARAHPRIGIVADPASALFGAYGPRFGFALGRYQALWLFPTFERRFGLHGAGLEITYALMPLGKRLEGLRLAGFASAARFPADPRGRLVRVGAEAGYAHLWGRLYVGASAGAARAVLRPQAARDAPGWELVLRAELGWVFL